MLPALSDDAPARGRREAPDLVHEIELRDDPAPVPVQLLPHEYVFGFFMLFTWARLVSKAGPVSPPALTFFACILSTIGVTQWAAKRPSPARWRVRLVMYAVLMGISFFMLPSAFALLELPSADGQIIGWEHALLGSRMFPAIQAWEHPVLTDLMMLAYLFFFYYLVTGPAYYCIHDLRRFRECFVGLFTIYGLGFLGYTAFPAAGPYRILEFGAPLATGWFTDLAKPMVDAASNGVDAFPSIHCAVSLYLLVFDAWHHRRRFWRMLAPCIALWASTIYLRYHYGVDVLAGVALSGFGLCVAAAYERFAWKTSNLHHPIAVRPAIADARVRSSFVPDEA